MWANFIYNETYTIQIYSCSLRRDTINEWFLVAEKTLWKRELLFFQFKVRFFRIRASFKIARSLQRKSSLQLIVRLKYI